MRASIQGRSPHVLVHSLASALSALMPSVRIGDVEGVHQARVTTRRLREVLPLLGSDADGAADTLKQFGRALGAVRELDVLDGSLAELAPRATFAMTTIAAARSRVRNEVLAARRKMVKAVEREELECVARLTAVGNRRPMPFFGSTAWKRQLENQVGSRAGAAGEAIHRAATVYMPGRSHAARIAIKKLRYSLEVARDTALWQPPRLLKDLRRVQESLGEIHDRQMLVEWLDSSPIAAESADEVGSLKDLLRGEIDVRHRGYLAAIGRLDAAVRACQRWSARQSGRWRLHPRWLAPIAAAVVVPALLTRGID